MELNQMLKTFNAYNSPILGITQDATLELPSRQDVDLLEENALGDVLHYLGEAMDCIEPFIDVKLTRS